MDQYVVYTAYVTDYAPTSRTIPANVAAYLATISNSAKKRFSSAVGKNLTLDDALSITLPDGDGWCRREAPNYIVVDVYDGTGDLAGHSRVRRRAYFATIVPALSSVGYTAFDLVADPWATVTGIDITSANVNPAIKGWIRKTTDVGVGNKATLMPPTDMVLQCVTVDTSQFVPVYNSSRTYKRILYGHCVIFARRGVAGNIYKRIAFAVPITGAEVAADAVLPDINTDSFVALDRLFDLLNAVGFYEYNVDGSKILDNMEISGAYVIPAMLYNGWGTPYNSVGNLEYKVHTDQGDITISYPATRLVDDNIVTVITPPASNNCIKIGNLSSSLTVGMTNAPEKITCYITIDIRDERVAVTLTHGNDSVDIGDTLSLGYVYNGITQQQTIDRTSDAIKYATAGISAAVSIGAAAVSGNPLPLVGLAGTAISAGSNAANAKLRRYSENTAGNNFLSNMRMGYTDYNGNGVAPIWGCALTQWMSINDSLNPLIGGGSALANLVHKYGYDVNHYRTIDISGNVTAGVLPQWYQIDDPEIDRTCRPAEYYTDDEIIAPVAPTNADFDAVLEKFSNGVRLVYAYT